VPDQRSCLDAEVLEVGATPDARATPDAPAGAEGDAAALRRWAPMPTTGAPLLRDQVALWTGDQMIVWGHGAGAAEGSGARFTPGTGRWIPTGGGEVPTARADYSAIWTGSEMLLWGGRAVPDGEEGFNDGSRYSPGATADTDMLDEFGTIPFMIALQRWGHSAVFSPEDHSMVVWGGTSKTPPVWQGARFELHSVNMWSAVGTDQAPPMTYYHSAVWTGSAMVVWGGYLSPARAGTAPSATNLGGIYIPGSTGWTPVTTKGAPAARARHSAVWTGSRMIVWGGEAGGVLFHDGASYDPAMDRWTPLPSLGAPEGAELHSAVWTGNPRTTDQGAMIIWGGLTGAPLATGSAVLVRGGARYDPARDSWSALPLGASAPSARYGHSAVWTGSTMIVWGGLGTVAANPSALPLSDGAIFTP
jgi:hypothetical protein